MRRLPGERMLRHAPVGLGALLLSALACSLLAAVAPAGIAEAAGLPPLSLSATTVAPGTTVQIEGSHWPPHLVLQAAVCGRGTQAVSSDCDLTNSITFGPADNGVVGAPLVVMVPPSPCPCVVAVTESQPPATEFLPITIEGAPSAPIPPTLPPAVSIRRVQVVDDNSWTSWFGAAANRNLLITVHNGSADPISPLVVASWLRGSSRNVITSPPPRLLAVGATATISVPLALATFEWGTFPVVGEATGGGFEKHFSTNTSTYPWGLIAIAIAVIVFVLVTLVVLVYRRVRRNRDEEDEAESEPPPESGPDAATVEPAELESAVVGASGTDGTGEGQDVSEVAVSAEPEEVEAGEPALSALALAGGGAPARVPSLASRAIGWLAGTWEPDI